MYLPYLILVYINLLIEKCKIRDNSVLLAGDNNVFILNYLMLVQYAYIILVLVK